MMFSSLHPVTLILYFISVLAISMFSNHPLIQIFAFIGAIAFLMFCGKKRIKNSEMLFYALVFILVTLTNPLFSHNGRTILFYINNNPITLESIYYGMYIGIMMISVICWFRCFTAIMTTDKLLYLLSKFSYKTALLISSALRFVPLLRRHAVLIKRSQMAMGLYSTENWFNKIKSTLAVYSSLVSWSLENAIDTGAAMKARGYGLKGRKQYSLFKVRTTDICMITVVIILDSLIAYSMIFDELDFSFYPQISFVELELFGVLGITSFTVLCMMPFILELKENIQCRYYRSRISM